ncbi:hypothetical protein BROUX41_004055 [Berkeleyomyces rouxiae]
MPKILRNILMPSRKWAKDASKAEAATTAAAETASSFPAGASATARVSAPSPTPTEPVSSQNSFAVLGDIDFDMAENPDASQNA